MNRILQLYQLPDSFFGKIISFMQTRIGIKPLTVKQTSVFLTLPVTRELLKMVKIIEKNDPENIERIFILDSTMGQNAYNQIEIFKNEVGIDSIILTKTDGEAKGGTVIRSVNDFQIPVAFICYGEKLENISPFDPASFISSLF